MKCCHNCGHPWESAKNQPAVKDFCEQCSAYLHCCLNCRFRDPAKHNECAIPNTDWVGDRAGANFCDEFDFKHMHEEQGKADAETKAKGQFDRLFGESSAGGGNPKSFDDLFKN